MSFLHLLDVCDNFRLDANKETLASLSLSDTSDSIVVGLLRAEIVSALRDDNERSASLGAQQSWTIHSERNSKPHVSFARWIDTAEKRSGVMKALCERWRATGLFADIIGGHFWRDELYAVYVDPFGAHDAANRAFNVERAACALFGVVTYGVHMTIYHPRTAHTGPQVWVPTRSLTKAKWPGCLDNSVAGGIPAGMSVFDSLVKESMEEASIEEDIVRGHAKAVGAVSYFFQTAQGWLQPEVEYVYDLPVPVDADASGFQPKPLDGEVESFELLSLQDVITKMHEGRFKPNCALVLLDFMIRHGYMTPENEPHYMEIVTRLHGRFEYDKW